MLYKRSSFIHWLQKERDCEVIPIRNTKNTLIKNGVMKHYMWFDKHDRIDYEEVWTVCNNLMIVGLPGEKDLIRIE